MAVRTLGGSVRKSTSQVADVRRPLVSASHIMQAGSELLIGKKEVYVTNRMMEKSVSRKGGNVYVLGLFVKVPSSATAPIKYEPMEVDAINQVADAREPGKQVTLDCSKPFFMAGGVSVEVRSKRAETVRPLHDEHCECQFVCDSALSAKSEMNDTELNGWRGHGGRRDRI